ncbi:MAG: hypothetical protein NVSMB39_4890 [Candidatus Saccharimonadales bacterium]
MVRFLKRQTPNPSELLTSRLHDQTDFYPVFSRDLSNATREVIIESPFVSHKRMNALYPSFRALAKRGVVIVINTRHPSEHDGEYVIQASSAISELQNMGVIVLFTGGHHRKLAILDRFILWEGSLNILSQSNSCEIMRRIEAPELAEEMVQYIGIERYI